jgi:hypothetical protein
VRLFSSLRATAPDIEANAPEIDAAARSEADELLTAVQEIEAHMHKLRTQSKVAASHVATKRLQVACC